MLSKEGCEKALARIVNDDYYFENDPYEEDKASAFDKDVDMIEQLIEEHFEPKENTEEYKHFKLHSDSTLKNQTKEELIDYIKMLYHNWGVCDGIEKLICQIGLISKNAIHREYVDGTISDSPFEENRFFPVLCANLES